MSNAGAQAYKFCSDVVEKPVVWVATNTEANKFLEFGISDNKVSVPLWSSKSRAQKIIKLNSELLAGMSVAEISWNNFINELVPNLRVVGPEFPSHTQKRRDYSRRFFYSFNSQALN